MKGARKGVMRERATAEGRDHEGDASDGRVSGLVSYLVYNRLILVSLIDSFVQKSQDECSAMSFVHQNHNNIIK